MCEHFSQKTVFWCFFEDLFKQCLIMNRILFSKLWNLAKKNCLFWWQLDEEKVEWIFVQCTHISWLAEWRGCISEHLTFDWKSKKALTQGGDVCKCQIRLKEQLKRNFFQMYFVNYEINPRLSGHVLPSALCFMRATVISLKRIHFEGYILENTFWGWYPWKEYILFQCSRTLLSGRSLSLPTWVN